MSEERRSLLGDRRQRLTLGAHLLVISVGVLVVEGVLPVGLAPPVDLSGPAPEVLATVEADYFRRERLERQVVVPPRTVDTILVPTLGFPARLSGGEPFPVVLDRRPREGERWVLIPRADLDPLDEILYALPPMPGGEAALRRRIAEARRAAPVAARHEANPAERQLFKALRDDPEYSQRLEQVLRRIDRETSAEVRERVRRVRHRLQTLIRKGEVNAIPCAASAAEQVGSVWRLSATPPADLPPGLYALALLGKDSELRDVQLGAAYRPQPSTGPLRFIVAGDIQWGPRREVLAPCLRWVSLLNGHATQAAPDERAEFAFLVGDVVDCNLSSADSLVKQLYGGATEYPREYLQVWLALAALRVPVYITPGNHDGYRFEGAGGDTYVDGLLLFESTFGPRHFRFDRPPYRMVCLNSFDLPALFRTGRRSASSSYFEAVSEKLNVLNWGGGLREPQHAWLQAALEGRGELTPLVFSHHDPRGSYPTPEPTPRGIRDAWSIERHFPLTGDPEGRDALGLQAPPRGSEMREAHLGFYTPLKHPDGRVRTWDWFDYKLTQPNYKGFPGWTRYQQGWHTNSYYAGQLDGGGLSPVGEGLVDPADVLATLVRGKVRVLFKAHDNRFCRAHLNAGENILGSEAEEALSVYGQEAARKPLFGRLTLKVPLDVYHVADVSDATSEGHGFYWVEASPDSPGTLEVLEVEHF